MNNPDTKTTPDSPLTNPIQALETLISEINHIDQVDKALLLLKLLHTQRQLLADLTAMVDTPETSSNSVEPSYDEAITSVFRRVQSDSIAVVRSYINGAPFPTNFDQEEL